MPPRTDKRKLPWSPDDPRREKLAARNRAYWTGRKHRKESIEKFKAVRHTWKTGRPSNEWTEEQREAMREKMTGRKHRPESRLKMSLFRKGKPLSEKNRLGIKAAHNSPEVRARQSFSHKLHAENPPPNCGCGIHKINSPTRLERILGSLLGEFPEAVFQKQFSYYVVDYYLPPPYHLAFEADGAYWHDTKKDARRDKILLRKFGLPVIRFTERELLEIEKCARAP